MSSDSCTFTVRGLRHAIRWLNVTRRDAPIPKFWADTDFKIRTKPIFFFNHCIMFCYLFNREAKKLLLKINYFHQVNMTLSVNVDKFSQSPKATFITFSQEILFSFWKTIQNPCSERLNMNVFQTGFLFLLQRILVWFAIQLTSPTFTASRFLFN